MDESQTCTQDVPVYKKTQGTRRVWLRDEEVALNNALKELVANGWKSDNGFRVGYIQSLEGAMATRFPGGKHPTCKNINSKLTVWKKVYGHLLSMSLVSGFRWCDRLNTIEVDQPDVWQTYVKVHPYVKYYKDKSFPFYKDWKDIWGKDRAAGENAKGYEDVVNELNSKQNKPYIPVFPKKKNDDPMPDIEKTIDLSSSSSNGEFSAASCFSKGRSKEKKDSLKDKNMKKECKFKKRKSKEPSVPAPLMSLMESFINSSNLTLSNMATLITKQEVVVVVDKCKLVHDAVMSMNDIPIEAKLFVADKIVKNPHTTDLFLNMNPMNQSKYVEMMILGKII